MFGKRKNRYFFRNNIRPNLFIKRSFLNYIYTLPSKSKVAISYTLIIFIFTISYLLVSNNYTNENYKINNLRFIKSSDVELFVKSYLKENKYFKFNSKELEENLTKEFPLIIKVKVTKSLTMDGTRIDIVESEPKVKILYTDGSTDILLDDGRVIENYSVPMVLERVYYLDENLPPRDYILDYTEKALILNKELEQFGVTVYSNKLNRLGTLAVNVNNYDTVVYFDLNEINLSIDEQLKVIQNVLVQRINFKVADLRHKDLVVSNDI